MSTKASRKLVAVKKQLTEKANEFQTLDLTHKIFHAVEAHNEFLESVLSRPCDVGVEVLEAAATFGNMIHESAHGPHADQQRSEELQSKVEEIFKGEKVATVLGAMYFIMRSTIEGLDAQVNSSQK